MPWYTNALYEIFKQNLDLESSTPFKAMLVNEDFTFAADDVNVSDIVANEWSGTGYTGGFNGSGRKTITGTLTQDGAGGIIKWDGADPSQWTSLNGDDIQGVVIILEITNDAASLLICFIPNTGGDQTTNGSPITFQFNADGIARLTPAP
jgi:hypothetical protein